MEILTPERKNAMRKFHFTLSLIVLLLLVIGLSISLTASDKLAENKAVVRHCADEIFSQGKLDLVDQLYAPNYVYHGPDGEMKGPESVTQAVTMYRTAFPDIRVKVEDFIAEGDKVVARYTITGTHQGDLMGIAPTGKPIMMSGISIHRIADGKIVEEWDIYDRMGMMQQLGVIPMPEQEGK